MIEISKYRNNINICFVPVLCFLDILGCQAYIGSNQFYNFITFSNGTYFYDFSRWQKCDIDFFLKYQNVRPIRKTNCFSIQYPSNTTCQFNVISI